MGKRTLELNMIVHVASEIQFFCLFLLLIQLRAHTLRQEEQTIKYYLAFHCFSICTDNGVFSTLLYRIQFHFRTCHGSFFAGNVVEQRKHKTRQRTQTFVESELGKDTQQVDVGRFVAFAERLRSLSCWVYLLHLLSSIRFVFKTKVKRWMLQETTF